MRENNERVEAVVITALNRLRTMMWGDEELGGEGWISGCIDLKLTPFVRKVVCQTSDRCLRPLNPFRFPEISQLIPTRPKFHLRIQPENNFFYQFPPTQSP